jgi:hypothetical protein
VEGPPWEANALGTSDGKSGGVFEEQALQQAGSRAQDAIKRLDCGTQPMGLMGDEPK